MTESRSSRVDVADQGALRKARTPPLLAYQGQHSVSLAPASGTRHLESRTEHNCEPTAGVGSQEKHSDVTEHATVNGRIVGLGPATESANTCAEPPSPLRRNILRRIAGVPTRLLAIARITPRPSRTNRRPYYPPRREVFIENAAMDREMFRL